MASITIGCLNIQSGINVTKGFQDYLLKIWRYFLPHNCENLKGIKELINKNKIDVLTLLEVDGKCFRSKNIDQSLLISKITNLKNRVFFPNNIIFNWIKMGNSLLSNNSLINKKNYLLSGGVENRGLGMCELLINNKRITLFFTHLSTSRNYRKNQISQISSIIKKLPKNRVVIMSGDFNTDNNKELTSLTRLGFSTSSVPTYPSWNPKRSFQNFSLENVN